MYLSSRLRACIQSLWVLLLADGVQASFIIEQATCLLAYWRNAYQSTDALPAFPAKLRPVAWEQLREMPDEKSLTAYREQVLPWLIELSERGRGDSLGRMECRMNKGKTLKGAMVLIEQLFAPELKPFHADVYNALVQQAEAESASYAQHGGSYFTPLHIASLLANLVQPRAGETIADLSCGSGRLLWSAYTYVLQTLRSPASLIFGSDGRPLALSTEGLSNARRKLLQQTSFIGCDINPSATLQAEALLHSLDLANVHTFTMDALSQNFRQVMLPDGGKHGEGVFDVILGNPPWGNRVDAAMFSDMLHPLHTAKPEVLFVELALQLLKPGGRGILIVPDGLLFNREKAYVALRQRLLDENCLHAIVSLPSGVFYPFTGVKTSILLFSKGGSTKRPIWCYEMAADGQILDRKRREQLERNDIPDLLIKYHLRTLQPLGAWIRETQALADYQHGSFLQDDDVQLQWENISPECYSSYYATPYYVMEDRPDCDEEMHAIPVFRRSLAYPSEMRRDWEVARSDLDAGDILTIGRYKPDLFAIGG
ncbi:MAG: N-6 DNA methylase [Ktedonobacteraceae bacterium]|nr:N-6 DNA methylase [Ktedonobacteraceae bacterium]